MNSFFGLFLAFTVAIVATAQVCRNFRYTCSIADDLYFQDPGASVHVAPGVIDQAAVGVSVDGALSPAPASLDIAANIQAEVYGFRFLDAISRSS